MSHLKMLQCKAVTYCLSDSSEFYLVSSDLLFFSPAFASSSHSYFSFLFWLIHLELQLLSLCERGPWRIWLSFHPVKTSRHDVQCSWWHLSWKFHSSNLPVYVSRVIFIDRSEIFSSWQHTSGTQNY